MADDIEYKLPPEIHHTFVVQNNSIFIKPYFIDKLIDAFVLSFRFDNNETNGISSKVIKDIVLSKLALDKVYNSPPCSLLDEQFEVLLSSEFIEALIKYTELTELNTTSTVKLRMNLFNTALPVMSFRRKERSHKDNVVSLETKRAPPTFIKRDLQDMPLADWGRELCRTKFVSKDNLPEVVIDRMISSFSDDQMEILGSTIFECIERCLEVFEKGE